MRTPSWFSRLLKATVVVGPVTVHAQATAAVAPVAPPSEVPTPLSVTAGFSADRFVTRHATLELTLNRPLTTEDGEVAVVVGSVDLTAMFAKEGTRLVYRSRSVSLPSGDQQVTVYQVRGGKWAELARFPVKVLSAGGFTKSSLAPSLSLNNKGQLAEGRSGGIPEPERRTFQDFSVSSGERSSHERRGWSVATQSNYVGVTRQQEALRFGTEGEEAPRFDITDYLVMLRGNGGTQLSLGHVNFGRNRHLVNGFTSRGATFSTTRGGTTLSLGSANGSTVVGWSNFLGVDQPHHRLSSAALGLELVRRRPGAFHVEITGLDGSRLPQVGFTRGAVVDAEESRGGGIEVSAATPSQRARFAGGYTRSNFVNPARDPQLTSGEAVVPVRRDARGARYVELGLGLLQNAKLFGHVPANATLGYRHERVDPLFRSIGAIAQADRQQNAVDLSTNLGVLTAQIAHSRTTDNLDHVPSVLTSPTHVVTAAMAAPLAGLLRVKTHQAIWPSLTYSLNRTHQFARKTPTNGDFRPSDVPDQVSILHDAGAQWAIGHWRASYRLNANTQDNRQPGRERSDFTATSSTVSLGSAVGTRLDVSLDANLEQRHNKELDQRNVTRRIGTAVSWRPDAATTVGTTLSVTHAEDDPKTTSTTNGEYRIEAARTITLRKPAGQNAGTTGQLVLRYARTRADAELFSGPGILAAPGTSRTQWTLSSGLSLRVF
jgi:hypothetical protein